MGASIFQFLGSALVIVAAGVLLTRCADLIAEKTGLGRALVGSILLAGATSLPELMVDLNAIWLDQPDLAVGDLLGSSLFNLLILALIDSVFRHPRRAFTSEFGHHAQTAVLSINLTALVGIGILSRAEISLFGVGFFNWVIALVYFLGLKLAFGLSPKHPQEGRPLSPEEPAGRFGIARAVIGFLAAGATILFVSPFLIQAADQIARESGLGHTFVGTTLVALSTSLPELVATLTAFRIGAPDLALGNIFGSNTFNMALFIPLDVFYPADLFSSVQPSHALTAFCVIAVSSVAVLGQVSRKRERRRIWEPSSELIVILVVAFLLLLFRTKGD